MPEWTLPAQPASVPLARRLVSNALSGVSAETAETVALLVSELVTNCVRHAHTDFRLRVSQSSDQVRLEVTDRSDRRPALKHPTPADAHGRGLQIVQVLARRWGVLPADGSAGKTVWCTVAV